MKLNEILPDLDGKSSYACSELAERLGRHSNTLRKYETWGFINPVPREANGYRRYNRGHALQALFAVTALRTCFEDWRGRRRVKSMIALFRAGDYDSCRSELLEHRRELEAGLRAALEARTILEEWRRGGAASGGLAGGCPIYRGEAARLIGVAPDTLRDWERNGLVSPRRLPNSRRIYSAADLEKLRVVQVLRKAGYSLMGLLNLFRGGTRLQDLTFARDKWDQALRGMIADTRLMEEILEAAGALVSL